MGNAALRHRCNLYAMPKRVEGMLVVLQGLCVATPDKRNALGAFRIR